MSSVGLCIYYFYFMFFTCFILDFSSYFYPENSYPFFLKILGSLSWKSWEVYPENLGKFCLKNQIRQNRKVREVSPENPWKFGIIIYEKLGKYLKNSIGIILHEYYISDWESSNDITPMALLDTRYFLSKKSISAINIYY